MSKLEVVLVVSCTWFVAGCPGGKPLASNDSAGATQDASADQSGSPDAGTGPSHAGTQIDAGKGGQSASNASSGTAGHAGTGAASQSHADAGSSSATASMHDAGTTGAAPAGCVPGPGKADLVYSWTYLTATSVDANGMSFTDSVGGTLVFRADGRFQQDLYIGDVLNSYTGSYEVCPGMLVFHLDEGNETQQWEYTAGTDSGRTVLSYRSTDHMMMFGLELEPCGDNQCAADETAMRCPNDCGTCGDALCSSRETKAACAADCTP